MVTMLYEEFHATYNLEHEALSLFHNCNMVKTVVGDVGVRERMMIFG